MPLKNLIAGVHPRLAIVLHDLFMVWLAWFGTNFIRFNLKEVPPDVPVFAWTYVIVLSAQGVVLWWTGLYRGLWRFASLPDLWNIVRGATIGAIAIAIGLFLYNRLDNVPRAVLFLYPLALSILLGAPRMLYRYWKDSRIDLIGREPPKRVLILGAGRAGETLLRDLKREGQYKVVGFLDDNLQLRGTDLAGVPILGQVEELERLADEVAAEMLLIAMPSANNHQMRRTVELCEKSGIAFRTVPRLQDVVDGRHGLNQLKEVAIDDLLGRDPVSLDWTSIRTGLSGKRVLVTGGGGSIGSELCRQIARLGAESMVVLELAEYNLYRIGQELKREFPDLILVPVLGDCTDPATCERVFEMHRPQIVFHAAAFKHVPLLQSQVREAFRNNVLATQVLAHCADRHKAEVFLLISTDKAVNPANVMGATKRAAEMVCQSLARNSNTHFITVRFGNVLDSAGSVVPLFREQIAKGGPVTVTHPEISRYFMTIPEACQLIMQAAVLGNGGEIFVLDMGEPIQIRYLAEQMIRLANKIPGKDIEIVYTGLRPGEKLFEELFHENENNQDTAHAKIFLAESRLSSEAELAIALRHGEQAVRRFDESELLSILRKLVPEFDFRETDSSVVSIFGSSISTQSKTQI